MRHLYHQKQKVATSKASVAIMGETIILLNITRKKSLLKKGKSCLNLQRPLLHFDVCICVREQTRAFHSLKQPDATELINIYTERLPTISKLPVCVSLFPALKDLNSVHYFF